MEWNADAPERGDQCVSDQFRLQAGSQMKCAGVPSLLLSRLQLSGCDSTGKPGDTLSGPCPDAQRRRETSTGRSDWREKTRGNQSWS